MAFEVRDSQNRARRSSMADGETPMAVKSAYAHANISIWWDIENCSIPRKFDCSLIARNIKSVISKQGYQGALSICVYRDIKGFPNKVLHLLGSSGFTLTHVPKDIGSKDSADKKMMVDMLLWAIKNPPPATFLLISGDLDFSYILHRLGNIKYNILLVRPRYVSPVLDAAADTVWLFSDFINGGDPMDPQLASPVKSENSNQRCLAGRDFNNSEPTPRMENEEETELLRILKEALDLLEQELVLPSLSNVTDCIYFHLQYTNVDIAKAIDIAKKREMVTHVNFNGNSIYLMKGQIPRWINPDGDEPTNFGARWNEIHQFLYSPDGSKAIVETSCLYEAALILKQSCLQQYPLGVSIQVMNSLIKEKKWISTDQIDWQPVRIAPY